MLLITASTAVMHYLSPIGCARRSAKYPAEALPEEMLGKFDIIISNPPYIGDSEELPIEVNSHFCPPIHILLCS